jgi:uncharacterized SAM-binding protein YcdF (DUF218 family)
MKNRPLTFVFPLTLFLATCWIVGFSFFYFYIFTFTQDQNPDSFVKADAIVVLTGGPNRIDAGIWLLKQHSADCLFISGVASDKNKKGMLELSETYQHSSEEQKKFLRENIILGKKAKNTVGNAQEVSEWVKENEIHSFYLVTSDIHLPRAMLELKNKMPDKVIYPKGVSRFEEISWKAIIMAFVEYNKFLLALFLIDVLGDR